MSQPSERTLLREFLGNVVSTQHVSDCDIAGVLR
jgi:hypothetical protein